MDAKLIYVKTPIGDEAVRQSTRVVQRNLRMVLVQVDGKLNVAELSAKIGNPRLVEGALRELEEGGFIATKQGAVLVREPVKPLALSTERVSAISQFSTFGKNASGKQSASAPESAVSQFSSFGKPVLPAAGRLSQMPPVARHEPAPSDEPVHLPRRTGSVARWLLAAPFVIGLLLLLLVVGYPYDKLKPGIEAAAGKLLQVPVQVGSVGVAYWPRPALLLADVRVGESADVTVDQVRIASPLSLLGSAPHLLSRVDLVGVSAPVDFLVSSRLFQASSRDAAEAHVIQRLTFEKLTVSANDLALKDLSGEVVFKNDGGVEKASFANVDLGIRLSATPAKGGFLLDIEGFGWKPFGQLLSFDSLQAKGLLQKGKLVVQSFDTTFLNGILKGSWLLDWSGSGLSMAGDATLARLDCRKVSTAFAPELKLEGELGGSLRLRGNGKDWDALLRNIDANLDADITRGILHGVDLGEAVRRGAGFVVNSGSTKFDRLKVAVAINPRQVVGRDIQMSAGMVTASGQFLAAADRPVDAGLLVTMQSSVATARTSVRVSGVLPNLSAVSGR